MWVCCCGRCRLRCWRSPSSLLESVLRLLCDCPMEENIVPVIRDRQSRRQLHALGGESPGRRSIIAGLRARAVIIASSLVSSLGGGALACAQGWRMATLSMVRAPWQKARHAQEESRRFPSRRTCPARVARRLFAPAHACPGRSNATTRTVSFIVLTPYRGCPPRRLAKR